MKDSLGSRLFSEIYSGKSCFQNIDLLVFISGFFIQKTLNDFSRHKFIKEVENTYVKFLESFYW